MRAHPSRLSSLLLRAFTGVFCLLFLAITAAVLFATERHPEEYTYSLQPARMLLFVLFWAALFAGVFWLCRRFGDLLCRHERWIAAAMVAVLAAGSLLAGWLLQVDTLNDVRAVFLTAQGLAREGAIPADFVGYFYIRPNNVASAVFLSLWLRATALFGCADPGFSALLLNALLITLSGALLRLLVREIAGPAAGLQALFALLTCIPLYAYAAIYYSDLYAMPFVAGALLLYCRAGRAEGRRHLLLLLSCGLLLGIGIWIKVSVGVVAIAMLIHTLFQGKLRALLRFLALAGLPILLFLLAGNLLSAQLLPDAEQRQSAPLPYNHWIMMGLEGDGRWNNADEVFSASFGDPSLAAAADWEVIRQRVSAYGPLGWCSCGLARPCTALETAPTMWPRCWTITPFGRIFCTGFCCTAPALSALLLPVHLPLLPDPRRRCAARGAGSADRQVRCGSCLSASAVSVRILALYDVVGIQCPLSGSLSAGPLQLRISRRGQSAGASRFFAGGKGRLLSEWVR